MGSRSNGKTGTILEYITGITYERCVRVMSAGRGFTMNDHPQDSVYSFVERVYMRLQAGDILTRCLEEGCINPIQDLVEGLVLAGPKNLDSLREILDETDQRKTQVGDDLHQVFTQFSRVLMSYGVASEGETPELGTTLDSRAAVRCYAAARG